MKKTKQVKPVNEARPVNEASAPVEKTRDLVIANRMSGKIHGGVSRIRLSLAFRIALHYCIQLLRSLIPVILALTVVFGIAVGVPVARRLRDMTAEPWQEGEKERIRGSMRLNRSEESLESDFFPLVKQQASLIFGEGLREGELRFLIRSEAGDEWLVRLETRDIRWFWMMMIGGVLLADLLRMLYFFRHDQRLNRRVLSPIRDITSMAETLSENNLSNRINIAGTQNELKDLANVINKMLDRIELSYNSQKQFVSDASHELRTPISVIRGYTDMLRRWGKDDPEVLTEAITAISQETEGMKDLVESLLFLARHDKKTLMMEVSSFDPSELVTEVRKEEEMVHTEHTFNIRQVEAMRISADRGMVKQVIRILCDNAVKYSPEGTEIILSCRKDGVGNCVLSVEDHGQGISREDLPKIFERFYRSDKARKSETGGHGLGLSIARIIVVAHEGKINVRSRIGEGTVFSVVLPAGERETGEQ